MTNADPTERGPDVGRSRDQDPTDAPRITADGLNDPLEDHEPLTTLGEVRAPHNAVAAVSGLEAARTMIEALEQAGIEATHISLLGAQKASNASEVSPEATDQAGVEVEHGSMTGAAIGAGAAGLTGAAIGIPGVGPLVAGGLWAIFGAGVGAAVGGVSSLGLSQAWEQTFEAVKEGNVAVGVHSDDEAEVTSALEVMEGLDPLSVNRFDD